MKRLYCVILLLAAALLLNGCFADQSTSATLTVPDIVVEGLAPEMQVLFGQNLTLEASASVTGEPDRALTYLWEMDLTPGKDDNRLVLGEGPTLDYRIACSPSDKPYLLTLTVKDAVSGLSKVTPVLVYVSSTLGEGLLVAHTRDGGAHTELDLVSSKAVTYGSDAEEPVYTRDIYPLANDGPLEGRVNVMTSALMTNGAVYNEPLLLMGSDEHFFALETTTYKKYREDLNLFGDMRDETFKTTAIFTYSGIMAGAVVNDVLYVNIGHTNNVFNKAGYPRVPANVFNARNVGYNKTDGDIVFFNEAEGNFYYMHGMFSGYAAFSAVSENLGVPLAGSRAIAAGSGRYSCTAFFIQTPDGKYHLFYLFPNGPLYSHYEVADDHLDEAVAYAFCDNSDIFFYATPDKVYSVLMTGGTATTTGLSWAPDSPDEKITGIRQYMQAWYGTHQYTLGADSYPFPLATNRLQVLITTYNETTGEGKIYLRPFNVSTGRFTFKDNGTFSGFGEITALATTFK